MSHIACDLDGTLAYYDKWRGIEHIGAPIPGTLRRVKAALAAGHSVSVFTARMSFPSDDTERAAEHIRVWCLEHVGVELPVTAVKHGWFDEFWDDKAIRVYENEGIGLAPSASLWTESETSE